MQGPTQCAVAYYTHRERAVAAILRHRSRLSEVPTVSAVSPFVSNATPLMSTASATLKALPQFQNWVADSPSPTTTKLNNQSSFILPPRPARSQ